MKNNIRIRRLALLQLEQYDTGRYQTALRNNGALPTADRFRRTIRMRLTEAIALIAGIPMASRLVSIPFAAAEKMLWLWVRRTLRIRRKHGMVVVAIAGSYGKTSVKHYAYEFLRSDFRTVATPESYNTVGGIAKTLYWEVDKNTEIFLAETGAYQKGDISRLLNMLEPTVGVLTGIARQHLERFGSFENIITAKSEIAVYEKETHGLLIANRSDSEVQKAVKAVGGDITWYGKRGERDATNIDGGRKIAGSLGMDERKLKARRARLRPVPHRFELTTERYGMLVIDDSYSSNEVGFEDALRYLGKQKNYSRIIVTPGLVELGDESARIHRKLGKAIVGQADYVLLVGDTERTRDLAEGIGGRVPIQIIPTTLAFMETVKKMKLEKAPMVLLENDVTENY